MSKKKMLKKIIELMETNNQLLLALTKQDEVNTVELYSQPLPPGTKPPPEDD